MENPIEMDALGVPLFLETPIWGSWPKTFWGGTQMTRGNVNPHATHNDNLYHKQMFAQH